MTIADALTTSRAAHRMGRAAILKDRFAARDYFRKALSARLEARKADPEYTDPAWGDDLKSVRSMKDFDVDLGRRLLLKKDETEPEGYDQPSRLRSAPGASVREVIQRMDLALEAHFRHHLGESANVHSQVDLRTPNAVIPPDQWQTFSDGVTPCATCQHPEAEHDEVEGCKHAEFVNGELQHCPCELYAPTSCRHTFVNDSATQRTCKACGEVQRLRPTMKVEETLAFKQLQREQKSKA